jgi:hypothetical protein
MRPPSKDNGQSLSEYGLILGLVVVISVPVVMTLGQQNSNTLGAVAANQTQLDRLSGLLGAPALTSSSSSTAPAGGGNTVPTGGGDITGVPGTPIVRINGATVEVTQDANGLLQVNLNNPEANNGNVSSSHGDVARMLAAQLEALIDSPPPPGQQAAPDQMIQKLADRFKRAASFQDKYDTSLQQLGDKDLSNEFSVKAFGIKDDNSLAANANRFVTDNGKPYQKAVNDYESLLAFVEENPALLQDPRVKPLLELGVGIYFSNYVAPDALNTKLTAQLDRLEAQNKQTSKTLEVQERGRIIAKGSEQIRQTQTQVLLQSVRHAVQTSISLQDDPDPPQEVGLNPPEIKRSAGAQETRQVADQVEAHGQKGSAQAPAPSQPAGSP